MSSGNKYSCESKTGKSGLKRSEKTSLSKLGGNPAVESKPDKRKLTGYSVPSVPSSKMHESCISDPRDSKKYWRDQYNEEKDRGKYKHLDRHSHNPEKTVVVSHSKALVSQTNEKHAAISADSVKTRESSGSTLKNKSRSSKSSQKEDKVSTKLQNRLRARFKEISQMTKDLTKQLDEVIQDWEDYLDSSPRNKDLLPKVVNNTLAIPATVPAVPLPVSQTPTVKVRFTDQTPQTQRHLSPESEIDSDESIEKELGDKNHS